MDITLHPKGSERLISNSELMVFNIHENAHCIYVKTFAAAQKHCIERQAKIKEKCQNGSFCGTCYAGVKEYVYPISNGDETVGFICVSGYKSEKLPSCINACSKRFDIPLEELKKSSFLLKEIMPDKAYVDTLVMPLVRMLELAYGKAGAFGGSMDLIDKIINYVNRNYAQNISIQSIGERFACSRSYISHNFKKATGKSFREYLTDVRIKSAKSLLSNSNLSVTEIALSLGFGDSNYFSNVFKNQVGVSPVSYRKQNR